jgi:uncharacterized protein YwlG (UPF0340 family)
MRGRDILYGVSCGSILFSHIMTPWDKGMKQKLVSIIFHKRNGRGYVMDFACCEHTDKETEDTESV